MSTYQYTPLDSAGFQIRLLTLPFEIKQALGKRHEKPLTGTLKHYYLPSPDLLRVERMKRSVKLPLFLALSYVWGRGTSQHEILIDGKPLSITSNLYAALRDMQSGALGELLVWADAICINQGDFAERSAQVRLMRDIYHLASTVRVWLGPRTEETNRCAKFIASITGDCISMPSKDNEPSVVEEAAMKAALLPVDAIVRAGSTFGQTLINIVDIMSPSYRDDKATMVLDPDSNFSLHQQTIDKLASWRPSARHLKRAQKEEDFTAIAHLVDTAILQNSEWFERMWVVQEVGAAESVEMQYGQSSIFWTSFLRAVHYLNYTCQIPMENIGKVTGLEKIRLGWNEGKRQPLRELLWDTRFRHATDPRDKIYSLLGLMGDSISRLLQPDYTKSVCEVYSNAAHHLIAQNSSLDPICGQQVLDRQGDLPTWVPDYALDRRLAASPLVRIDGSESIYAATGYDYHSRFLIPDTYVLPKSWGTLRVTGLCIDNIIRLSDQTSEGDSFGDMQDQWFLTLLAASGSIPGFTQEIHNALRHISSVVRQYSDNFSSGKSILNATTKPAPNKSTTEADIVEAYISTLLCGRISASERLTIEDIKALINFQSPDKSPSTPQQDFFIKTCEAFQAGMNRRKLAVTKEGFIGAVPDETQQRDIICVLLGCSVPIVLREVIPVTPITANACEPFYQFVGECYLHGFMDAEAIVMLVKETRSVQEFILK